MLDPAFVAGLPRLHQLMREDQMPGMYHWVKASRVCGLPVLSYKQADQVGRLAPFVEREQLVIVLEIRAMAAVMGYALRSVPSKSFVTSSLPGLYLAQRGLQEVNDFRYGYPIVLCEGAADAEVLSQAYPYVCAFLSAGVTQNQAHILSCFTNRVILVPDNDPAGIKGTPRTRKALDRVKVSCEVLQLPDGIKDPGELVMPGNEFALDCVLTPLEALDC